MSGLIVPFKGIVPKVASSAFIAPNATVVGEVGIGANCSIWFGVILRGDGPGIRIGENSNLQDGTVVDVAARGLMTVVGGVAATGRGSAEFRCSVSAFRLTLTARSHRGSPSRAKSGRWLQGGNNDFTEVRALSCRR